MIVVNAFDLDVVRQTRLAGDVRRERILRVEEFRVRPERARGAWNGRHHALEVAAEAERHRGDLLALDEASGVGTVGLERGRLRGDIDRLRQFARLQRQVDADRRIDVHLHAVTDRLPEAGQLRLDAVDAILQIWKGVHAALVCDGGGAGIGLRFSNRDGGAWDRRARAIDDVAEQRAANGLSLKAWREAGDQ